MDRSNHSPTQKSKRERRRSVVRTGTWRFWFVSKVRDNFRTLSEILIALPMLVALMGAMLGILCQHWLELSVALSLGICTICALIVCVGNKFKLSLFCCRATSLVSLMALMAGLYQLEIEVRPTDRLRDHATSRWKPVILEGTIREATRYRPQIPRQAFAELTNDVSVEDVIDDKTATEPEPVWTSLMALEVSRIVNGNESCETYGLVTVAVDGMLEGYLPGDHVQIAGRMILIGPVRNPGEPDYQEWMQRRGEWVRFRAESAEAIEKLGVDYSRYWMKRWLAYFGHVGRQQLAQHLPEPQCSLAAALLLGQREQVGNETNEKLLATGTIHLLSISGLHVEMIAVSLMMLAIIMRLPRSVSLWGIGVIVLTYAMVTGSNPPVVRATVLVLGVLSGRWMGRPASVFNMLGLAGVSLLVYQPSLLFDLGTELSFLAVFCLVLLSRSDAEIANQTSEAKGSANEAGAKANSEELRNKGVFRSWLLNVSWPWFKSMCSMNLGVWLATTPLVLYHFNILSPIALLLNILLWLPVLVAMLSGLALMVFGWIPGVGTCLGWICLYSMISIEVLVDWGYAVHGGHVWLPEPSWFWLILAYVLVGLCMLFMIWQVRWRFVATAVMLIWIVVGGSDGWWGPAGIWREANSNAGVSTQIHGDLRIQVLDVGHGSAVVIRLPDGAAWLYDAGRLGDQQQVYKTISQALWQLRVARLDGIILSHADADHYSGMRGVVGRFVVDRFAAGPRQWEHSSPEIQSLHRQLQARQIGLLEWNRGDELKLGQVVLRVIHPPHGQMVGSDNARSVCMLLEYAGRKVLLPGDLESPGMEQVAQLPSPNCDVVMAPHHGSLSGNPRAFLDWCGADWVLISGSERAQSAAVLDVYGAAGREVYVTAKERALELRVMANGNMELSHWNENDWEQIRKNDKQVAIAK